MAEPQLYMVFDVESIGLHGEGFAVGWVVVDGAGRELESGSFACDSRRCSGPDSGRRWVFENCPALPVTHLTVSSMRAAFWEKWRPWKAKGAVMAADCPWPVEARFLAGAVDDARPIVRGGQSLAEGPRDWEGPYPFIDVASVRLAAGLDPLGTEERLPSELPIHDPLADARQSARLFIEALNAVRGRALEGAKA
jgi:hypothetical protein